MDSDLVQFTMTISDVSSTVVKKESCLQFCHPLIKKHLNMVWRYTFDQSQSLWFCLFRSSMIYWVSDIFEVSVKYIFSSSRWRLSWDPGRSVKWGLGSQFCQPILLQTKCTGLNNGIIIHVGKILFILYENSDWKIWPLL